MFTWAKTEVAGFEDLSPLDQKALLRRTVAELVMLGFARGSIAYDGVCVCVRICMFVVCLHTLRLHHSFIIEWLVLFTVSEHQQPLPSFVPYSLIQNAYIL